MVIYIEIVNRLLCPCREGWLSFEKFFQTASADYQVIAKRTSGALLLSKFGNLSMREILVVTS